MMAGNRDTADPELWPTTKTTIWPKGRWWSSARSTTRAMKLEADVEGGRARTGLRRTHEDKVHECHAAGDAAGAAWWEEVFRFLMWRECVAAGTETIILEDGETYDYENEEVIRAGTNQPRSDTENR